MQRANSKLTDNPSPETQHNPPYAYLSRLLRGGNHSKGETLTARKSSLRDLSRERAVAPHPCDKQVPQTALWVLDAADNDDYTCKTCTGLVS